VSAEDARSSEKFRVNLFKRGDEWLYAEGQAVENASDDETGERKGERMAKSASQSLPSGPRGPMVMRR